MSTAISRSRSTARTTPARVAIGTPASSGTTSPASIRYRVKTRDPVAAHLGERTVGVPVVHEPLGLLGSAVPPTSAARRPRGGRLRCFAVRTTRSTPSAPMPRRRSQSAATRPGVSSSAPSGSGRMTKSLPVPWPLMNCTPDHPEVSPAVTDPRRAFANCVTHPCLPEPPRTRPNYRQRGREQIRSGGVQPGDPGITAEPGPLPADEPPGGPYGLGPRLRFGEFTVEQPQHLLVPECPAGGTPGPQPPRRPAPGSRRPAPSPTSGPPGRRSARPAPPVSRSTPICTAS